MTREEAIKLLMSCCNCDCCDTAKATRVAIKALEAQGWIPTKERLPDENGWYIITYRDFLTKEKKVNPAMFFDKFEGFDVIAWMPLPEVYRGDRDDK